MKRVHRGEQVNVVKFKKVDTGIKVGTVYGEHNVRSGSVWFYKNKTNVLEARYDLSQHATYVSNTKEEMEEKLRNGHQLFCKVKWLKASEVIL